MSYFTAIKTLYSLIFISLFLVQNKQVFAILESYEVYVASDLPINSSFPLNTHCLSEEKDLGDRTLDVGDYFAWHLRMNIKETTRSYCFFGWGEKIMIFDVFNRHIADDCGGDFYDNICYWIVKEDGFYLAKVVQPSPSDMKKFYNWQ